MFIESLAFRIDLVNDIHRTFRSASRLYEDIELIGTVFSAEGVRPLRSPDIAIVMVYLLRPLFPLAIFTRSLTSRGILDADGKSSFIDVTFLVVSC